eukprot:Awhi_evm1s8693
MNAEEEKQKSPEEIKSLREDAERRCKSQVHIRRECELQFGKGEDICNSASFSEK